MAVSVSFKIQGEIREYIDNVEFSKLSYSEGEILIDHFLRSVEIEVRPTIKSYLVNIDKYLSTVCLWMNY